MIDTQPDVELHADMTDAPSDSDLAAARDESDKEFLRIARDAYISSTTYFDASVRRDVEQDLRQWQSQHLMGSKYLGPSYAGRSRLFVPKTRAAITKFEAAAAEAFFSSHDVVSLEPPNNGDEMGVIGARFHKELIQLRLTEPPPQGISWFLTCLGAYQEAHVAGIVVSKAYWSKKADRPAIDLVPIENFRFDPACDWRDPVATSPYCVQLVPMYVKDIKERMRDGRFRALDDGEIDKGIRRQTDTIRSQREGQRTDSQDINYDFGDYNICLVHENIAEIDGEDWVWYTILETTMLSDPVPLAEKYAHGRPHRVGFVNLEANRQYPSSTPHLSRDVQREINELRNQRIDNVAFVLNKRYFVKRGKQVDTLSLTRNVAGAVTLMDDPEGDVRVVETPDVTASSYQEQDRHNLDFDDVVGSFSQSSIQSNRNLNETVGGMNLLNANTNQIGAYKLRTFVETWVEPVLRQIVELERAYETDEAIIAMAATAANVPEDMDPTVLFETRPRLIVNVGMTATNPQEKANMLLFGFNAVKTLLADGALEQRGLNARELVKEVFAMIGYRDGSRFFKWADDDPVVGRLQEMIADLQGQLAAKHPPELIAAQIAKYEREAELTVQKAVAEGVKAAYSAMQAGQVIASVPSVAPIADEIMRTAGWQPQPGADPNFPQPAGPDPALMQGEVGDRRTGVSFQPPGNTSPMLPGAPETGEVGMGDGIETLEADGVEPAIGA